MKAFVLAFTSALIIESLIFYSLGIWLSSPEVKIQPIVKLRLSSIQRPIKKKIVQKIQKVEKPQFFPLDPAINKIYKKSPLQNDKIKPKNLPPKIIKPKKRLPKRILPKKIVIVKKKQRKQIKRKKEFNPYKNIVKQKPVVISKEKVRITNQIPIKKPKVSDDKAPSAAQKDNQNTNDNQLYLSKVSTILSRRKKYPRLARKRGIEGQILVAFKIDSSGATSAIKVLNGKNKTLRKAAKRLISNCKLPVPPKSWMAQTIIKLPINYKLRD